MTRTCDQCRCFTNPHQTNTLFMGRPMYEAKCVHEGTVMSMSPACEKFRGK